MAPLASEASRGDNSDRGNAALVFIGFMGSGKSTAAAAAAGAGLEVADADELLARELGMPISEFFERHGEEEFRAREEELAGALLEGASGGAIALGGGSVLSPRVRDALARHITVWLDVPVETAWERAGGDGARPLAMDRSGFEALYAEREPLYLSLADAVVPSLADDVVSHALPSLLALRELPGGTRLLWAASASGQYPVFVGNGILESGFWPLGGRRFCVTDATVGGLWGQSVAPLEAAIEIEPGEESKALAMAERVWRELAERGMARDDHLVALGGGVVGDLAGFCAATYQRGVAMVQVPTTLVAQVDSAYGGKTGVDLPEAKNYVGAYHMPSAVLADSRTLETLPPEELAAGFVEVLKTGLLAGGALWEEVRGISSLDAGAVAGTVFECARYKVGVVAADERDAGRRAVLNLGHTVGHAIEQAGGYARHRHGEAVGLGLLASLRLSDAVELRNEVESLLERHSLPTRLEGIDTDAILDAVERDKKRTAKGVGFVLLARPGEPQVGQQVDPARVREAVDELFVPRLGS